MYTIQIDMTQSSAAPFDSATHELITAEIIYLTSVDTSVVQVPEKPLPLPTWKESDLVPNPK